MKTILFSSPQNCRAAGCQAGTAEGGHSQVCDGQPGSQHQRHASTEGEHEKYWPLIGLGKSRDQNTGL